MDNWLLFIEKIILPPIAVQCKLCHQSSDCIYLSVSLFWFIFSCLLSIPHCPNYCNFITIFKSNSVVSPTLLFFFSITSVTLHFLFINKFQNQPINLPHKNCWNFQQDWLNLKIIFRSNDNFTILNLLMSLLTI